MKRRCFQLERATHHAERDHAVRDVSRVLLVMSEYGGRILGRGCAMRKCSWPESGVSDRSAIHKQLRSIIDSKFVSTGKLHEEIMRMLAIDDWQAVCSLAGLKQFRILSARDRQRFETDHGS